MNIDDGANVAAAGWYRDPRTAMWQWWDGSAWTGATRRDSDWRMRIMLSPLSYKTDGWVRNAAFVGLLIAAALLCHNLATGRAVVDVGVLALLGFPVVFFGQFWVLSIFWARYPTRKEEGRSRWRTRWSPNPFVFFVRGISKSAAMALAVVFVLGWLAAMSSFSGPGGQPTTGDAECPYALNNHGSIECVSQATYEEARSRDERLAAGVFGAFFAVHIAGAAGEVNRRRREGPSATALSPT